MRDLDGMAAIRRNLPDVVDALQYFPASGLDVAFIRKAVRDEIDGAIRAIHGPEAVTLVVTIRQMGVFLRLHVHDPEIGGIAPAIVLAPPDHGMAVEDKFASVRGVAAPISPIGGDRLLQAAINGYLIKVGNAGIHEAA